MTLHIVAQWVIIFIIYSSCKINARNKTFICCLFDEYRHLSFSKRSTVFLSLNIPLSVWSSVHRKVIVLLEMQEGERGGEVGGVYGTEYLIVFSTRSCRESVAFRAPSGRPNGKQYLQMQKTWVGVTFRKQSPKDKCAERERSEGEEKGRTAEAAERQQPVSADGCFLFI